MRTYIRFCYCVWGCVLALIAFIVYEAMKVETPPFWFNDSQLGWESIHYKVPQGADQVSTYMIRLYGIRYLPWNKSRVVATSGDIGVRFAWEGEKMLFRSVNGQMGIFVGGGRLHPPLIADPNDGNKPLREVLSPDDDGYINNDYRRGLTVTEVIEMSGGIVRK
jgi:hypothetical protein